MIYVFIVFLIFLVMGVPVAFAIGASGMVFFLLNTHFPLTHIAQLPLTQVQSISMLAIPLFILAGNLMNNGGVTKRLVSLATLLTGHEGRACSDQRGLKHSDGRCIWFRYGRCSHGSPASGA